MTTKESYRYKGMVTGTYNHERLIQDVRSLRRALARGWQRIPDSGNPDGDANPTRELINLCEWIKRHGYTINQVVHTSDSSTHLWKMMAESPRLPSSYRAPIENYRKIGVSLLKEDGFDLSTGEYYTPGAAFSVPNIRLVGPTSTHEKMVSMPNISTLLPKLAKENPEEFAAVAIELLDPTDVMKALFRYFQESESLVERQAREMVDLRAQLADQSTIIKERAEWIRQLEEDNLTLNNQLREKTTTPSLRFGFLRKTQNDSETPAR